MIDRPVSAEKRLDGADRHPLHTDEELMQRWLRAQAPAKRGGMFLWSKVGEQFCVGSHRRRKSAGAMDSTPT